MQNTYSRFKLLAVISVFLFFYAIVVSAREHSTPRFILLALQQQEVHGTVTDQNGVPIPGVSVIIKGTNRGTVTNVDGEYNITAAPQGSLLFSYLGYKPSEVSIDGRREINILLVEDISSLEEVEINAGYYNTTRRESTGNISRVTAEEIQMQPVISPLQALQGRMAGVEITPGGSHPGMAFTIRIRGRNSLREDGNFPLYIIDGVPINSTPIESNSELGTSGMDPLNTLNLSNIKSVEVLKDADATAIYGSRGANGVVLITTKKGHGGRTGLEASIYTGVATVPNKLDLLNTQQYLQIRRQAFENDGIEPTTTNAFDLVLWDQERYTDWQELFFGGTSSLTNASLATSGGDENTSFRLGGSYHKQGTVYPADFDYQKITAGLNFRHVSENKKLEMDLSVNYGLDITDLVGNVDLSHNAFYLPPNAPGIFTEDGELEWQEWAEAGWENPLAGFFNTSKTQSNNLVSSLGISYKLIPGLSIKSNFGYTNLSSREIIKRPKRSYSPTSWENLDHSSLHLENGRKSWIVEPQLEYRGSVGTGNLNVLLGGTFQESDFRQFGLQGEGYVSESLIGNLTTAERIINANSQNTKYRYAAVFGRLGINWGEKYFLNFTGRRDGSSRFGPGKKVANFGAIGGAWIFSEDLFKEDRDSFLSFGKLRASYGITGNDQIGDYGYLDAYEATLGPGGLYPTQLSNPDYSWEINKKLEGAVELGFLKDHINLSVAWYRNRSSNQLIGYALPSTTGFATIQANLPATVENTGLEVELSTLNFLSKNFDWQTSFNFTLPKNELLEYPGIEQSSYANTYKVGHPLNISLLYQYEGLDPETGYYQVTDVNEDGKFDFEDRIVVQHFGREFSGGINNNITYKNLSLQFLWEFVKQDGLLTFFNAGSIGNQRAAVMGAFDDGSRYQQVSTSSQANNAYSRVLNSPFSIVDASYLRLKTFSLAYNLPSSVLQQLRLRNGKIFLNGKNLLTLTSYEGIDPEMPIGGTQFAGLRTITGGLQVQF